MREKVVYQAMVLQKTKVLSLVGEALACLGVDT